MGRKRSNYECIIKKKRKQNLGLVRARQVLKERKRNQLATFSFPVHENHDGGSSEITVGTANADNTFQLDISMNEDSLQADDGKEIKVFCPKCNVEITHTAEGIQEDQTKIVIAKVYHYFEQEYEELKKSFNGLALTPLSKFRQRTALATGVSETTVLEILQEEARRNADVREGPSQTEGPARKRPRQTDSSSEEESENSDDGDVTTQSSTVHGEVLTLVIKEEPEEESLESYNEESEIYVERPEVKDEPAVSGANDALADPISIDFKTEPRTEESTSSNDTPVVQSATKSYNEAPTAASAPPAPPGRQLLLLHEGDIKTEQIESEEGFR